MAEIQKSEPIFGRDVFLFAAGIVVTWFGNNALYFGVALMAASAFDFLSRKITRHKDRKMLSLLGMIICAVGLLAFSLVYFWPQKTVLVAVPQAPNSRETPPFLTLAKDASVGGGIINGRLGGHNADLKAIIYTQDTSSVGSGRGVTLTVNLINNDSRPVYLNGVILLEVYFLRKSAVWDVQQFKDMFSAAVKSGAGFRYQAWPEMAQAYRIAETGLYFAKYPASKLTYNGNQANGLITIAGNTVSQFTATFDTPKLNRDQFNGVIEAIELDVLNDQGFAVMRLCPISVTYSPPFPEGGHGGWDPLWGQSFQVVPNKDDSVVCQPASDSPTSLPASPP